jgi:DNA-binding transcriptional LysR family regulator
LHWSDRIGRRLTPRDLHVFMAVAEQRSMAKAAERLAVSRPVVSKTLAGMEALLGVRLFDRVPGGVALTSFGSALLRRSAGVFDALRQGVEELRFLADPGSGTVRVSCNDVIAAGIVAAAVERLARRYPGATFDVEQGTPVASLRQLRDRRCDLLVLRVAEPEPEVELEPLFNAQLRVVCGVRARWAARRRIGLADLVDEPWIQSHAEVAPGGPTYEAFRALGLPVPSVRVFSNSLTLRYSLLESGRFVTMVPESALRFGAKPAHVKVLPVAVPPWNVPTAIATLKGRTLAPLAALFIDELRKLACTISAPHDAVQRKRDTA